LVNEKDKNFHELSPDRQRWLLQTGSRYAWAQKLVVETRMHLYRNLKRNGIDGEETVLREIDKKMKKYFTSFKLKNASSRIEQMLKENP
jgi:hypothetical protein